MRNRLKTLASRFRCRQQIAMSAAVVLVAMAATTPAVAQRTATLPLEQWLALQKEAKELRAKQNGAASVVISAAEYDGASDGRNLRLTLRLRAFIEDNGSTEAVFVPVAPTSMIVTKARVLSPGGAKNIGLQPHNGHHAWQTTARGAVALELEVVVPPSGPRGSFEYQFSTVSAVRTTLRCAFPTTNLGCMRCTAVAWPTQPWGVSPGFGRGL